MSVQTLSGETKASLARFRLVIKALLSMHPRMTTSQATTFLYVAMSQEEFTVSTLASLCRAGPTTISKHLKDFGTASRHKGPSLGLLTTIQRAHDDRRQYRVVLTGRGVVVARMLSEILRGQRLDLGGAPEGPAAVDCETLGHS